MVDARKGIWKKSRSTGSNIPMNGQLPGRPFILVDYPDVDFPALVIDSTYVSPKVCCLPCQKSDPSIPRKSDVFKINDDIIISMKFVDSYLHYASIYH